MKYDLITAKQAIRDLFPQLQKFSFAIWQDSGCSDEQFKLQCYVKNSTSKHFYGHTYKIDLLNKTFTN